MTATRLGHRFGAICAAAALALGLLVAGASSASAQYTLTFDGIGCCNSDISSSYGTNSFVGVLDGTLSGFGSSGAITPSGTASSGLKDFNDGLGADVGDDVYIDPNSSNLNGAFNFTPLVTATRDVIQINSLVLGNTATCSPPTASTCNAEVQIYSIVGNTLLYSDIVDVSHNAVLIDPTFTSGPLSGSPISAAGGLRLEFGPSSGLNPGTFTIDQVSFDAEATSPEPGALMLLGTGLIGLAPMIRRRRRKA